MSQHIAVAKDNLQFLQNKNSPTVINSQDWKGTTVHKPTQTCLFLKYLCWPVFWFSWGVFGFRCAPRACCLVVTVWLTEFCCVFSCCFQVVFNRNMLLCLHVLTSLLRLFRLAIFRLQMMIYFFSIQVASWIWFEYGLVKTMIDHSML